ncbi:MAG TPA: asparagine synthase (glutamine-hydrolyzing) [bacterium]|nr:asparagine synthase (glutamine-hydrolyzing) [bacterium]
MCGITGFLDFTSSLNQEEMEARVSRMADTLRHRGPDDSGVWADPKPGVALGHRRLAIVDLSPRGHQPMFSQSGRFCIVYNGEVYNFQALQAELAGLGHAFQGHSDTEVILSAISQWGLEEAVKKFVGMYAFALWDREEQSLSLVRDRMGEKPLYYGWAGKILIFASELKALIAHPDFRREINRDALDLYMRYSCIPSPYAIYKDTFKLAPASILTVKRNASLSSELIPKAYWSLRKVAETADRNPKGGDENEKVEHFDALLRDAIKKQMVADVPLGAFLSGGIDSSTIVALMQAQSTRPVKTFTIGFHEGKYNEAGFAKAVAGHLHTDHTELYVTPDDALKVIPTLPTLYDEPFADSSQIPTFLVSRMTRQHVTVSLSGDGGDELFGGYHRYFWGERLWNSFGWAPYSLRSFLAGLLKCLFSKPWESFYSGIYPGLPHRVKRFNINGKIQKFTGALEAESADDIYKRLITYWFPSGPLVMGASTERLAMVLTDRSQQARLPEFMLRMMYDDAVFYLPDTILTKVDRASMGVSLESRAPFLDHRVVEFAWQVPLTMKIRNGKGKWILRKLLHRYVPQNLVERPKAGFEVPVTEWLRGPLRGWAEALMNEPRLAREGFFDPIPIHKVWNDHLNSVRDNPIYLWNVLMFQAWLETQK